MTRFFEHKGAVARVHGNQRSVALEAGERDTALAIAHLYDDLEGSRCDGSARHKVALEGNHRDRGWLCIALPNKRHGFRVDGVSVLVDRARVEVMRTGPEVAVQHVLGPALRPDQLA